MLREMAARARSVRDHAKLKCLLQLLSSRGDPTVVFTLFRETLHLLERALEEAGIPFSSPGGEQSAAEIDQAIRQFAESRRVLLSTEVGSEGKNLQFFHSIVNYDLLWNPMRLEQRERRVHRIKQREAVLIDNLCARGSVEDHILRILDAKSNMFELVVGEIGVILGNLETDQEFEEMALDIWAKAEDEAEMEAGFDALGEQLTDARARFQQAQALDEALFGGELAAAVDE